eukprot:515212-Rhodomonas_salina.3
MPEPQIFLSEGTKAPSICSLRRRLSRRSTMLTSTEPCTGVLQDEFGNGALVKMSVSDRVCHPRLRAGRSMPRPWTWPSSSRASRAGG